MKAHPDALDLSAEGLRVGLIAARFNGDIVTAMLDKARETLLALGGADKDIVVRRVPGAFELPLAAQAMAATGLFDGLVALGAVIRGATPHFDFVAGECAAGLNRVQLDFGLPVGFGVITCATLEHALERAGGRVGNKGEEATLAVVEMIALLRNVKS